MMFTGPSSAAAGEQLRNRLIKVLYQKSAYNLFHFRMLKSFMRITKAAGFENKGFAGIIEHKFTAITLKDRILKPGVFFTDQGKYRFRCRCLQTMILRPTGMTAPAFNNSGFDGFTGEGGRGNSPLAQTHQKNIVAVYPG